MSIISPFNSLHTNLNANFCDYGGWLLPRDYGDSGAEMQKLEEHCAAFDLSSFGRISISGSDARECIEELLQIKTNGSGFSEEDSWQWFNFGDNAKNIRIAMLKNGFIVLTWPSLRHFCLEKAEKIAAERNFDVKIADQTEKTGMLGIYGPKSIDILARIMPFGIDEIEQNGVKTLSLFMLSITIMRGSWLGGEGVEIFGGTAACRMAASAIEKYQARENIGAAGMECFKAAAAKAGINFA